MSHIWIASYPRSGNTYLRTILWHCFGLRSASVYPKDLGEDNSLGRLVGHVELNEGGTFGLNEPRLIKTHNPPQDLNKTIYIVRDGRAAIVSLWHFYKCKHLIKDLIDGQHRFSTWTRHIQVWDPWLRPNTLLLRYEDIVSDLQNVLDSISVFLNVPVQSSSVPSREEMSALDGKLVRKKSLWQNDLKGADLRRFMVVNEGMMARLGYL